VYVLFFIVAAGLGLASVVVILERMAGAAGKTKVGAGWYQDRTGEIMHHVSLYWPS
jgi:hypothetical protein